MGFWGDGVYRYDQIEVRDQSDRAWDVAFIIPTSVKPGTDITLYFLARNNDILADIDDGTQYPNAIIGASYLKIYENDNRAPLVSIPMDDAAIERIEAGIYKYVWSAPKFTTDAFSVEITLETEYINPATTHYPTETIIIDRTFHFSLGGQGGGGGVTPVGAEAVSILVRDRTSLSPIPDVRASIYNSTGDRQVGYGSTNADGQVVLLGNVDPGFPLDPGTYLVRLAKAMVSFHASYSITVVTGGTNDFILEGSEIPLPVPPATDLCLVYGWLFEPNANPYAYQKFHVSIAQSPRGSQSGVVLTSGSIIVETDKNGYFEFYAVRKYLVTIEIPQANLEIQVMIPDQDSIKITDLLKLG